MHANNITRKSNGETVLEKSELVLAGALAAALAVAAVYFVFFAHASQAGESQLNQPANLSQQAIQENPQVIEAYLGAPAAEPSA